MTNQEPGKQKNKKEEMVKPDRSEIKVYTMPHKFTASKQDDPNRFRLHFYSPTGIEEDVIETVENIQMYAHNKTLYIKNKGIIQSGITQVSIYDIMGREIFNTDVVNAKTISIPITVHQGYYVVKAVVQTQVKVTKIYIK